MKRIILMLLVALMATGCETLAPIVNTAIEKGLENPVFDNMDKEALLAAGESVTSAMSISDAEIVELCNEYMASCDAENVILDEDDPYSIRLGEIMSRFKNLKKLRLNYAVYEGDVINAFASGDGSVRVYTGIMDVMDDDELFAVIGHELGHLINKDVRDSYRTAYLIVAARYGISAFGETAGNLSLGFLGDLSDQLANSAYSRHQETKADEMALQFCIDNGVDPFAMYKALNVLEEYGNGTSGNTLTNMFASHPDTAKRIKHIKKKAEEKGFVLEE